TDIISKFFLMGQLVTINQRLDRDSLEMICDEFKFNFRFEDEYGTEIIGQTTDKYDEIDAIERAPVVTIMGHVDHGKTSILDYIRNTNVVAGEAGRITQHIGAYQIEINKHRITFLDTPGHEAFTAMRARGANITDIAVIVVSATEGVKPQTLEAIDHAKAANVPIIIAINKIDLPDINVDKVIAQLLDNGIYLEQYGGEVPWCKTSVVTGEGILNLIELILLTAEMMELKAKVDIPACAVVIEAKIDTKTGVVVTALMQEGTLKKGDIVVCGATFGRIRKMENERGGEIKILYPSDVARIYGLAEVPKAGDLLNQVENEKTARTISTERYQIRIEREKYHNKTTLQNIFARINEERIGEVRLLIKADTDGSVEALADSFFKLSNSEVMVNIIHKNVGGINEDDVNLATASDAIIIGFHVRASHQAKKLAEEQNVDIRIYQVIYAAIDDVRQALEGMLKPEFEEVILGSAVVRQAFKIKKVGVIAGCYIERGSIQRQCKVRLYRNDVLLYEGNLASLKHFQNEVSEIKAGNECGMALDRWQDIKEDDILECYVIKQIDRKMT
ncbi:MAG: translation initiation factor IF-2, partial [Candidatus Cloacimonetes bacterium]|nr:translation initiation factor IF-2 [Candidatus Cloacimonadota bacterium]